MSNEFCTECRDEVIPKRIVVPVNRLVKDKVVNYNRIINYCPKCKNEIHVPKDNDKNVESFNNACIEAGI